MFIDIIKTNIACTYRSYKKNYVRLHIDNIIIICR